jgi:hypothetical protein
MSTPADPTPSEVLPGFRQLDDDTPVSNAFEIFQAIGTEPGTLESDVLAAMESGVPRYPVAGVTAASQDRTGLPGGRYIVGPDHAAPWILDVIAIGDPSRLVAFMPLREPGLGVQAKFVEASVLPEGVEAWTTNEVNDVEWTFYDTRFCLCRATYQPGATAPWRLSAIALRVGPGGADDTREEVLPASRVDPLGDTVDMTELSYFFPSMNGPGDEAQIRGRIGAVRDVRFGDVDAWEIDVVVPADTNANEWLVLPVLVGRPAWAGRHAPIVGGFLEGFAWVQGYRDDVPFATAVG